MRKMRLTVLTGAVGVFLFSVVTPIQAGPPQYGFGNFTYLGISADVQSRGCNLFVTIHEETADWTGLFVGSSVDEGRAVGHCNGDWSVKEILTFEDVEVDGESGGLVMSIVGYMPAGVFEWYGQWVILEGTGDLANLHGHGNWWGPGSPGPGLPGFIEYDGYYHFEPN
jgi:hypothetical protein